MGSRQLQCKGLEYITGEWPQASGKVAPIKKPQSGLNMPRASCNPAADSDVVDVEAFEDVVEEQDAEGDACVEETDGALNYTVECYWPDDDEWLPATVINAHEDGSWTIAWCADGS